MKTRIFLLCLLLISSTVSRKSSKAKQPPNVAVAAVEQHDVPIMVDAIGQAISPVTVQVRPQVAGKLSPLMSSKAML